MAGGEVGGAGAGRVETVDGGGAAQNLLDYGFSVREVERAQS